MIREKIALLCCTANQVGTGHKLYFQAQNPARSKLAAINNKMVVAQMRCDEDSSELFHIIDTII